MPTIAEVRQQYPQYSDMSDAALADALHGKFYSDMPREAFDAKIGLKPAQPSGVQRMGDLLGKGAQEVERGVKELATPSEGMVGVERKGQPAGLRIRESALSGAGDVIGGMSKMAGSPAGLISPAVERKTGIPKEITELAAPVLVPLGGYAAGRGLARALPESLAAKAPALAELRASGEGAPLVGNVAARGNTKAADKLQTIEDIKYRASLEAPGKREDVIRDRFKHILTDSDKRAAFSDGEIDQMEKIVRGTKPANLARWIEEMVGKSALGEGIGALTGGKLVSRGLTNRRLGQFEDSIAGGAPLAASRPPTPNPAKAYLDKMFPPFGGAPKEDFRKGGGGSAGIPDNVVSLDKVKGERAGRAEGIGFDRGAIKSAILQHGGLPQNEIDQITDHAIAAAKRYGGSEAAAAATKMESDFWDKFYKAALAAMK